MIEHKLSFVLISTDEPDSHFLCYGRLLGCSDAIFGPTILVSPGSRNSNSTKPLCYTHV